MLLLYLLDTNILVHMVRQDAVSELRSPAYQWSWGAEKKDQMRFLLGYFDRVPVDTPEMLEAYAVIDAYSESTGHSMGKNDAWIAAATHVTGRRLVTTDTDFDHLHPAFVTRDHIDPDLHGSAASRSRR